MGGSAVLRIEVDEELVRKARALGIEIGPLVEEALREAIRRSEVEGFVRELREEVGKGPRLPAGAVVKIIREMRDGVYDREAQDRLR